MNNIENYSCDYTSDEMKQHIENEINGFGAMCVDAQALESIFEQEDFETWLDSKDFMYYESYTICKKGGYKKEG